MYYTAPIYSFEQQVERASTNYIWANEYCILAMSIVLNKNIVVYDRYRPMIYFASLKQYDQQHGINIAFESSHFTALLRRTDAYKFPKLEPQQNQFLRYCHLLPDVDTI